MITNPKVIELEDKVVQLILNNLKQHQITLKRAREIANYILNVLKEDMNEEEFLKIVPQLDDLYPELAPVVLGELKKVEDTVGKAVKEKVSQMLKEGKITAASETMAKYFKGDIS